MKFFCDPQRCFFSLPCYVVIGLHDKNVQSFGIWPEYFNDQGILTFSQLMCTLMNRGTPLNIGTDRVALLCVAWVYLINLCKENLSYSSICTPHASNPAVQSFCSMQCTQWMTVTRDNQIQHPESTSLEFSTLVHPVFTTA